MNKIIPLSFLLFTGLFAHGQKIKIKESDHPVRTKVVEGLKFNGYQIEDNSADFTLEIFFTGGYWKGHQSYYKLYDKSGNEVRTSRVWNLSGYGGVAENQTTSRIVRDLDKYFNKKRGK